MRIGELSRRTGVNAHQLRYYEAQGLLEADRGTNGYREYDDYIDAAEHMGSRTYPPFDGADPERVPA
jgi:hypothetical protein